MRRKHLAATVLILPLANAFSLANFQQITSVLIPRSCTLSYNSQIPTCTADDFNNGCSRSCKKALQRVAESVTEACAGVILNPNSLLGIVKNGRIIDALCLSDAPPTTTMEQPEPTSAPVESTKTPPEETSAVSVTLPTKSPGVTGGQGTKTSKPASSASSTSEASTEPTSTVETTLATSTTSADEGIGGPTSTTTVSPTLDAGSEQTSSTSSSAEATSTSGSGQDTGGGSPFDITSSASRFEGRSLLGTFVVACWAFLIFGR
jgi:hypothetical protein